MQHVRVEHFGEHEVLIVDFSNAKEPEMIERLLEAREFALRENKKVLVLNIFNSRNYITPRFMRQGESVYTETCHLLRKEMAVVGLSTVQKMILKGFVMLGNRKLKGFDSVEEAIAFLVA
jgi:hypothetical protein